MLAQQQLKQAKDEMIESRVPSSQPAAVEKEKEVAVTADAETDAEEEDTEESRALRTRYEANQWPHQLKAGAAGDSNSDYYDSTGADTRPVIAADPSGKGYYDKKSGGARAAAALLDKESSSSSTGGRGSKLACASCSHARRP